jgi:hypothetical protein
MSGKETWTMFYLKMKENSIEKTEKKERKSKKKPKLNSIQNGTGSILMQIKNQNQILKQILMTLMTVKILNYRQLYLKTISQR